MMHFFINFMQLAHHYGCKDLIIFHISSLYFISIIYYSSCARVSPSSDPCDRKVLVRYLAPFASPITCHYETFLVTISAMSATRQGLIHHRIFHIFSKIVFMQMNHIKIIFSHEYAKITFLMPFQIHVHAHGMKTSHFIIKSSSNQFHNS